MTFQTNGAVTNFAPEMVQRAKHVDQQKVNFLMEWAEAALGKDPREQHMQPKANVEAGSPAVAAPRE